MYKYRLKRKKITRNLTVGSEDSRETPPHPSRWEGKGPLFSPLKQLSVTYNFGFGSERSKRVQGRQHKKIILRWTSEIMKSEGQREKEINWQMKIGEMRRRRTQSSAEQQKNDNKSNFSGRIVAVENLVASFYDPSKLFLVFLFWSGE
jgi:hypothetical protein